jgi:hypothetical protein
MRETEMKWLVTRIKGNQGHSYGSVRAPSAEAAIRQIIEAYEITDPDQIKRLAARPLA